MPIDVNISIESGEVTATASGSDEKVGEINEYHYRKLVGDERPVLQRWLSRLIPERLAPSDFPIIEFRFNITPESDNIEIKERSEIQAVARDTLRNRSSVSSTYSTTLKEERTNTVNVKWSSNKQTTRGFQIAVELFLKSSGLMSFTTTMGHEISGQKCEVVGSTRAVTVTLEPGQAVGTTLQIRRRTILVRVPFKIDLTINDAVNASNCVKLDTFKEEAIFEIVCFTDGDVEIIDSIDIPDIS